MARRFWEESLTADPGNSSALASLGLCNDDLEEAVAQLWAAKQAMEAGVD